MPIPVGPANLIKAQIVANLQALVSAGTLGSYIERDININILNENGVIPAYPCAVLGTSRMQSVWEFPQANKRTYTFEILVIQLQDNLVAMGDMEDLRDAIALQFDNNVTLNGTAVFGVSAVASEKMTLSTADKSFVVFSVTIKATTLQSLTYTF